MTSTTREGWPLLTVETKENGDSKSTDERGPSLVGLLGLLRWTRDFCPSVPFPLRSLFQFICPHRPDSHAGSPVS